MIKNPKPLTLLSFVAMLLLTSCAVGKKMKDVGTELAVIKDQQKQESTQLNKIDTTLEEKLNERKIDSNISQKIKLKLRKYLDYLELAQVDADLIDSVLQNKKTFRNSYKEIVLPILDSLKKRGDSFAKRMSLYLMTEDGLNVANYYLFDLAAFFGPGKYVIPDGRGDDVLQSFSPIFDSLIIFSNKYTDIPKTGTLIILGYADGTGFGEGLPFTDSLKSLINKPDVTKEDMNKKLSELRAEELIKHLTVLFLNKKDQFSNFDKIKFEYIGEGKGEEYPNPSIKNYTIDDERRRIVLCYWSVLPDE